MNIKTGDTILSVKNLKVSFGGDAVIENVNFDLKSGENLIIMGPNGSGKSVLLKTLLGLIPHEGKITCEEGIKIGYVPQRFAPEKNFPLNLEEFFNFKKVTRHRLRDLMDSVGLKDKTILKKTIGEISPGQLQRALIAWSLIDNPDVLLFDEPTTGIDIGGEETVYKLLSKLEKEKDLTIIFVTHDLSLIHKLADVVLCLNKKMVCYGTPEEINTSGVMKNLYGDEVKIYKHQHE